MYSLVIIRQFIKHSQFFAMGTVVVMKAACIFGLMQRRPSSSDANFVGKMPGEKPLKPCEAIDKAAFDVEQASPAIY